MRALAAALALTTIAACSGGDDDDSIANSSIEEPTTSQRATTTSAPDDTTVDTAASDATATTVPVTTAATTTTAGAETTTTVAETTTTEAVTTTTTPPVPVYPLTGVQNPDPAIAGRAALVVKVGNEPAARPQTGFNSADLVFEEIVNDNLTRFALVYHSFGSDPVGPVRSGRLQDIDLFGSLNRPLFAWSGGNPTVTRAIAESDLTDLNWQRRGGLYFRTGDRRAPSNLYTRTSDLFAQTPFGAPPPVQQFEYRDPAGPTQGVPSAGVEISLDAVDVVWTWNAEEGLYERAQEGRTHLDRATNSAVTTNNVVVMNMDYYPDVTGTPQSESVGWGEVFVFTNGHYIHGFWAREHRTHPWRLVADDGTAIRLTPGRTFIELPRPGNTTPYGP